MSSEKTESCQGCGATVYPEHLETGIAKRLDGKLLCSHCVKEQQTAASGVLDVLEPIPLDDDDIGGPRVEMSDSVVALSSDKPNKASAWDDSRFTRKLDPSAPGAIRCRLFHAKLSEGALEFLNNQVNEWLDQNDQITIKFVNSTIGMFESKHTEPNLILAIFY
ncbi:MAG: hypothetical protein IH897_00970 [Planctomycetes bacterium]|nr:hypothetical protein [Planctomycetota bacterium]